MITAILCIVLLHLALIGSTVASIIMGILTFMVFLMRASGGMRNGSNQIR